MARHREAAPEQTEYPSSFDKYFGSIAQLVQSICLTSRGSAVRTRVLPLNTGKGFIDLKPFFILVIPTHFRHF